MKKKEVIFVTSCLALGTLFFSLSRPLVLSTNWYVISAALLLLLLAQELRIELVLIRFSVKHFATLYLLLFLNPESIAVLSILVLLRRGIDEMLPRRIAFEYLQFAVGKFVHSLAPADYLAPVFFAFGFFLTNVVLGIVNVLVFSKTLRPAYLAPFGLTLALGGFSSFLVVPVYVVSSVNLLNLSLFTTIYVGYVIVLYYVFKAQQWRLELMFDEEKIRWETDHLMEITHIFESSETDEKGALKKILELACEMMGYEYALLNVFDFTERKVVRVLSHGLPEEVFRRLQENAPRVNEAMALFQQRFDIGGAYFIPKGSVDIAADYVYVPSDYSKFDAENAWDPDDLFLIPVTQKGKTIGYISFDKPKNGLRPTRREVEIAKFFSWLISMNLVKSNYSLLFGQQAEDEVSVSKFWNYVSKLTMKEKSFVIVMMDIDSFENYNHTHGYEAGDAVLERIKQSVSRSLKGLGVYCVSGDDFFVLLETSSKTDGLLFAESVLTDIRSEYKELTISSSVAKYPLDGTNITELLHRLKTAMKTVKKSGGGRIIGA